MTSDFKDPIDAKFGTYALQRPVLAAPAMNTYMWHQAVTRSSIEQIERMGAHVVPPVVKTLACGDTGAGAMASVEDIVQAVVQHLSAWESKRDESIRSGKPTFVV